MNDVGAQHVTESSNGLVARWWPVAVAAIGTMAWPVIGLAFALGMAFMLRWDRAVLVALITIAALGAIYLVLFVSASTGVVSGAA